jgi:hypothetical protein
MPPRCGHCPGRPSGKLFDEVAADAQPLAVVGARRATFRVVDHMVEMSYWRVAPWGSAAAVASNHECTQRSVEHPPRRVHCHEGAFNRMRIETSQPDLRPEGSGVVTVHTHEGSRPHGRNSPVARDHRGGAIAGEQCPIGHHHLDFHWHLVGHLLTGAPGDQCVGHDLSLAPDVAGRPGRVRGTGERREHRNTLGDRKQSGQVAHGVRRRPE